MMNTLRRIKSSYKTSYSIRQCYGDQKLKTLCASHATLQSQKLCNGIRIAAQCTDSPLVTVGMFFAAGSRYEIPYNNGVAHFLEHMLLKGTCARTQACLEGQLSDMGVHIKSHLTREELAFYATCLPEHVESIMCLFAEILTKPAFDVCEIEIEKLMIFQQIDDLQKDPRFVVNDLLHSTAFQGTPLGQSVLGTTANINKFMQSDLYFYLCSNLDTRKLVIAAAGCMEPDTIVAYADRFFGGIPPIVTTCPKPEERRYTGSEVRYRDDDMPLAAVAIAVEGVGWNGRGSWDKIALDLAARVIGSWSKTLDGGVNNASSLAKAVSKENLGHYFDSFNICYKDTGLWGVFYIAESLKLDDFLYNIQDQWMKLCVTISDNEIMRAKNNLFKEMLAKIDSTEGLCKDLGRQILMTDKYVSPKDLELQIMNFKELRQTMYNYIYDKCPVVAAYGPVEGLPDYTRIRSGMYWLRV